MKFLTQFLKFYWGSFARGKVFRVTAIRPLLDYETKKEIGWRVETVIIEDKTVYKLKDGESASNIYEKLTFKVKSNIRPDVSVGDDIEPVGEPTCSVYGDYRNMLSVTCEGVRVVPTATTGKEKA